MKTTLRLVIISLTLLLSLHSFSQSLIEEGKNWSIKEGYYPPTGGNSYGTKLYKIEGDTLINLLHYKKFMSTYDTTWTSSSPNGFIRMDSTKKVYYRDYATDYLIYDFNLLVGDTFVGNSIWTSQPYELIVHTVDSVLLENGTKSKRITFGDNLSGYPTEYWIEDIGSNFGLMYTAFYLGVVDIDFELLCCKLQNELLFINSTQNTCYLSSVGIDNPEMDNICVFPNPTEEKINVKGNYIKSVELSNIYGHVVFRNNVNDNYVSININNMLKGMYFLKVSAENGQYVYKIIKK